MVTTNERLRPDAIEGHGDSQVSEGGVKWAQRNPVEWIEEACGVKPWAKQREIFESIRDNRETAVKSCHGIGKSWTAAHVVFHFLMAYPFSKVITTAPTFRQVESIIWEEIRGARARARRQFRTAPGVTEWKVAPNWFARGISADNADSFQGYHAPYVLVVVDEASGVDPEIWKGVKALLSGSFVRLLAIGNPTDGNSHFAGMFKKGDVHKISVSAFETPNFTLTGITIEDIRSGEWRVKQMRYIAEHGDLPMPHLVTPEWVADIHGEEGETSPFWISRVMAIFPSEGEDTLIPLKWIERAQNKEQPKTTPITLGVDVAYMGSDKSVITARWGYHARKLREFRGTDTTDLSEAVIDEANRIGARVVNIDMGAMGAGVFDQVKKGTGKVKGIGSRAVGVNFGESPSDDGEKDAKGQPTTMFVNRKSQIFWNLRNLFKDDLIDIDPKDAKLATQLSAIKYMVTERKGSQPQIMLEKKAETKKKLEGQSPDDADALALAYADTKSQAARYAAYVNAR